VVVGDRRGRSLGFPTANLAIGAGVSLPPDGVYAGVVERADGSRGLAAISVGRRPQFYEDGERLVEVYLLDFDADLYGETIGVEIGEMVREQRTFTDEAELVEQMRRDVEAVRRSSPTR
jgi:riboflavin kinase / FMN adenylyltransferase